MTELPAAEPSALNAGLMEMPPTDGEISPFNFSGPSLIANGYSALPIAPETRCRGSLRVANGTDAQLAALL